MKTINIKNYNKSFQLPTCLEECTTEFFIKYAKLSIKEGIKEIDIISELSGLSVDTLNSLSHINLDDEIIDTLSWWGEGTKELLKLKVPKTIRIEGKVVQVPSDLSERSLGQKLAIKQVMIDSVDSPEKFFDSIPKAFAIYFAPMFQYSTGGMSKTAMHQKIIDIYPIVNFFLNKYRRLLKDGIKY